MPINFNNRSGSCGPRQNCVSKDGCPPNVCPDFVIRRHDTKPALKVAINDCDGPMDFRGLVIETNMWAVAKLKSNLDDTTDYFRLADDVGFEQILIGDIIVMDQVRMPERMLVLGFDEHNKLVKVQRGYHGTTPAHWKRGATMRIFRILNGVAEAEMVYQDVQNVDGTTDKDVLQEAYLVYEWQPEDTCLPGCYYLEFKVLKMIDMVWYLPGGDWTGGIHQDDDTYFWTGSIPTDSSVRLSYDQISDKYLLGHTPWTGEIHLHTDDNYYTGTVHNDGSVLLNQQGIPTNNSYDDSGVVGFHDVSLIPSFTDESLTPYYFGCVLGEGVEWVRRFPVNGEGFLVKIEFSPTSEL